MSKAFDNVETRLQEMARQNISTAVLSLLSEFTWIERLPLEESLPLVQLYNNSISELCNANAGRFTGPRKPTCISITKFRNAIIIELD